MQLMRYSWLAIMAPLALADVGLAQMPGQRIGPGGGSMAPGPSQPHDFTPGGIGAGGVPVAPGAGARGVNIDRIGPGGGRLAPGPAGSVGTGPTLRTQTVAPSSGDLRRTIRAKRGPYRGKSKRRPRVAW